MHKVSDRQKSPPLATPQTRTSYGESPQSHRSLGAIIKEVEPTGRVGAMSVRLVTFSLFTGANESSISAVVLLWLWITPLPPMLGT